MVSLTPSNSLRAAGVITGLVFSRVIHAAVRHIFSIPPPINPGSLSFQLVLASFGYMVGESFVIKFVIPRLNALGNQGQNNERFSRRAS